MAAVAIINLTLLCPIFGCGFTVFVGTRYTQTCNTYMTERAAQPPNTEKPQPKMGQSNVKLIIVIATIGK
jgi:hypothetical protein